MNDANLIRRFQRGDPEAIRALYRSYSRSVFTIAYGALGDRSLAEEAVQLTFTKAWRAAVDLYRRERRHESSELDREIAVMPPSFEGMWEAWEVRGALDRLPKDEREIIETTHYRQLTMAEAAEELGIPVGTVKSRSHRAHRRLAESLGHLREETA